MLGFDSLCAVCCVQCCDELAARRGKPRKKSLAELEMSRGVQQVKELIKSKKVVVVSKSWCGFCRMAKQTLAKYNISQDNLAVLEIDGWDDCDDVQDYMGQLTGGRSVPRVFIEGKFIGGGQETTALDKQGKLQGMLKEAGAI